MKIGDQEIIRLKMGAQSEDWEASFIPCRCFDHVACEKESSKITVLKFVLSHPLALTMSSLSCC